MHDHDSVICVDQDFWDKLKSGHRQRNYVCDDDLGRIFAHVRDPGREGTLNVSLKLGNALSL